MNKKAALSLSVEAIVIIVIAFVVLGLGLTLTKTIFAGAKEKLPEAFALTELEKEPSSEDPLTVTSRVTITRLKTKELGVGYYNKDPALHSDVRLDISGCYAVDPALNVTGKEPTVTSIAQDVGGSSSVGYKIIIKENGLLSGQYVCELVAEGPDGNVTSIWESDQFFLQVTT
jgi:hypothetical protein